MIKYMAMVNEHFEKSAKDIGRDKVRVFKKERGLVDEVGFQ